MAQRMESGRAEAGGGSMVEGFTCPISISISMFMAVEKKGVARFEERALVGERAVEA